MAITQIDADDKTYENELQEVVQLKNIIDSKEAEITALNNVVSEVKGDNKKLAKQIQDLEKDAKDMLLYP